MSVPKLRPDPLRAEPQAAKIQSLIAGIGTPRPIGCAPCTHACPVGINVKGYIDAISEGRFEDSLRLIREENPFAGVSGRICNHPCERECTRNSHGGPIGIRLLKRFVHDFALASGEEPRGARPELSRGPVAVVGAGPAGLSAARDLARQGVRVVVFEALAEPGGMLRTAIPDFRLPTEVLQSDLDYILSFGVEIRCNEPVGSPGGKSIEDLFREGFRAVFLATGAPRSLPPQIPGADTAGGVTGTLALLRELKAGRATAAVDTRRAAVVGGSFEAVAAARALRSLGVSEVSLYYPLSLRELPADPDDVQAALLEGVVLKERTRVLEIIAGENHRVSHLSIAELSLRSPDTSGRVAFGEKFRSRSPAELVVLELAREPDWSSFGGVRIPRTIFNTVLADPETLAAGRDGLFAGGDLVSGPKTLIEAVAHGRRAAASILRFLERGGDPTPAGTSTFEEPVRYEIPAAPVSEPGVRPAARPKESSERGVAPFPEPGYGENEATAEAFRCLRCGPCGECLACSPHCEHRYAALPKLDGLLLRMNGKETGALPSDAGVVTIAGVEPDLCRGCGRCEEVCGSHAPRVVARINGDRIAVIDPDACRSCGCCAAVCPTGAIRQGYFTREWLQDSIASAAAWSRPGGSGR